MHAMHISHRLEEEHGKPIGSATKRPLLVHGPGHLI